MTRRRKDLFPALAATLPTTRQPLSRCPYDGAELDTREFCPEGMGYPNSVPCPFACPICRKPLEWSGACHTCHGRESHGDPRCMPGDRYDLFDDVGKPIGDGQHWTKIERGPVGAVTYEQGQLVTQALKQFAGHEIGSIAEVFEHFPFRPDGSLLEAAQGARRASEGPGKG